MAKTYEMSVPADIHAERKKISGCLHAPMAMLASDLALSWGDWARMGQALQSWLEKLPYASQLVALAPSGERVGPIVSREGPSEGKSDWSAEPWLQESMPPWGFLLSGAHPIEDGLGITGLHRVYRGDSPIGFVAATLRLSDLPNMGSFDGSIRQWEQVKGDPAIRAGLFAQSRTQSAMDAKLSGAVLILGELIMRRGLFQAVIHFSGSRATAWFLRDPLRYVFLDSSALTEPHRVLAFPLAEYPADALIPKERVLEVLNRMAMLRMTDDTIYLRSASVNIFNGLVSLTFSCDGTHYVPFRDFLDESSEFWKAAGPMGSCPA